jgi:mannitol/fructose-specific phosphotransferase system IIA component (Ntr-type)
MSSTIAAAIAPELVLLDAPVPANREELFALMSEQLLKAGRIEDVARFRRALDEREALGSTYMGNDLALPHGRSSTVTRASIVYWRFASPFTYESAGESGPVTRAVMLAVPEGGADDHLRALAMLARMLLDDDAVQALDSATEPAQVVTVVQEFARTHG